MIESRDGITWTQRTVQHVEPVRLWDEPGPEDLERGERIRQQLTVGVVGLLFVVAVVFLYASGLLDGRRIETLECGGSVALPDGSIWVLTCDEGGAP